MSSLWIAFREVYSCTVSVNGFGDTWSNLFELMVRIKFSNHKSGRIRIFSLSPVDSAAKGHLFWAYCNINDKCSILILLM